jgi:hypothetical protein
VSATRVALDELCDSLLTLHSTDREICVQVLAQLRGEAPLPWEGDRQNAIILREKLGTFKDPILSLLHRDPSCRESLRNFQSLCTRGVAAARR